MKIYLTESDKLELENEILNLKRELSTANIFICTDIAAKISIYEKMLSLAVVIPSSINIDQLISENQNDRLTKLLEPFIKNGASDVNHEENKVPAGFGFKMKFGKYKGKTLAEILDIQYSYIIWLSENNILKISDNVMNIALDMYSEDDNYLHGNWWDMF